MLLLNCLKRFPRLVCFIPKLKQKYERVNSKNTESLQQQKKDVELNKRNIIGNRLDFVVL